MNTVNPQLKKVIKKVIEGFYAQTHTLGLTNTHDQFDLTGPLHSQHNAVGSRNEGLQSCIDHMQWIRRPPLVPQSPLYTAGGAGTTPSALALCIRPPTPASPPPTPAASASQLVLLIYQRGSRTCFPPRLLPRLFSSSASSFFLLPCINLLIYVNPFAVRMKLV